MLIHYTCNIMPSVPRNVFSFLLDYDWYPHAPTEIETLSAAGTAVCGQSVICRLYLGFFALVGLIV